MTLGAVRPLNRPDPSYWSAWW